MTGRGCHPEVRLIGGLWRIRCCKKAHGMWFQTQYTALQWAINHARRTNAQAV